MPDKIETPKPETNLVPIRQAYFSRSFWSFWDQLKERPKAAYVLGWISELETAVRSLSERIRKVEDRRG